MKSSEQVRDRQSLFNYNSSHNNFPAIESLNSIDIGTERQFWFTANMLADMLGVDAKTIRNRVNTLENIGDLSGKNFSLTKLPDSRGSLHETTIYDLTTFNKLVMTMIDNPVAVEARKAFNDVIVQVETTGQYNIQKQDPSYMIEDPIERAKTWIKEQEEKRALEAEKKALEEKNKELQSTNDELVTEVEILLNSYVNTKQVYEMYLQNYPEAPNQAKSTMMGKIRKALCNICNERKTGRKIYKKHILNQKNEIEWRQEYFFDQDTKQILFDRVDDDLNYIVNIKLR